MKKRILSIVLAICLVLSCIPITVFAANADATELQNILNSGGTVTLSKDYTIDTTMNVTNTVTLDLNGHVIKMTGSGSVIKVGSGGNLTMTDSNKTATHTDSTLPAGGVITGGNATIGGGVYSNSGSFTMTGGTIANCSAEMGSGVCVAYGSFTMTGGTIENCSAGTYGGGICGSTNGNITMTGGTIKNCTVTTSDYTYGGGGVFNNDSFTMSGGVIENCNAASSSGGGVYNNDSFTMSGGVIENCSAASSSGGGVFSQGDFSMSDTAIIRGCSAKYGGGVRAYSGTFTMTGGTIETCTSTDGASDAMVIPRESSFLANGGIVKGTAFIPKYSIINTTSTDSYTKFYDEVANNGTISGGVYYGGIQGSGTVNDTYYTVSFDLNGGSGSIPTQWFVNASNATALQPTEPTKEGFLFAGWYNGDTKYDFTQPVTSNIALTARWINGNVSTEAELREAIDVGVNPIKMVSDIKLSSLLNLTDKIVTIDLNGYVITGDIKLADNSAAPESILTLIDSRPTATHTDSSLPVGGVVKGDITLTRGSGSVSHLYGNGGTVTGMASMPSYAGGIYCTSDTPTAYKGYAGNYGTIHGGIFYAGINESCIKEKTVTFMNGSSRYALEVVADGNKVVAPLSPSVKTGYKTFDGWYNGDTKYTFGSTLSENITLTAKYGNPITYNISYNLDGGTSTNQTTYNVESDAITLNNPTKTGYTFTGWSGTGLTGEDNMTVTIAKGSTGNRTYTAHYTENSDYTVAFDTNGGSSISDKTSVKWTGKVLDGITAPTKDGWEFIGWKCGNVTVTADTAYCDLVTKDTTASVTLVAQWKDIAPPTGEISIGTNKWTEFLNNITFGLFFKDTQTVTITASDNSGEDATIEYLLSDKELTTADLDKATFTAYNDTFSINPDNEYVIYARLTDTKGNAAYINSSGIVLDATAPVISGVENGKTYCSAQTVTVTDQYLDSVTVNGTEVTLDLNNQFTLNPAEGTQTIVATDKAGNVSAEMIVTVNDGHTYEWQSENGQYWQKCKYCDDETAKKDIPTFTIDAPDTVCRTQDCEASVLLPDNIPDAVLAFEFIGLGGGLDMTVEDGKLYAVLTANSYPKVENRFDFVVYATTDDGFSFTVRKTVEIQNEHSGGEATCVAKAICEVCGEEYGDLDPYNHTGAEIRDAIEPTCTEQGYSGDTYCNGCGVLLATGAVLDITPHNYSRTVVEPTENKQGYTKYVCTDCGYSYVGDITDYASDNSALISALETIANYSEEDYSTDSFANLQAIYNQFSSMATGSYAQIEIDNAVFDLLTAISKLEPYLNLNVSAPNGAFTV
ncbi:MAG: InlB B-repeat-containing protein, partial [Eubacterium sp.]